MDDIKIINKIKTELLKYDYIDVMSKISLMNTIYKNQDNNILISCLINELIPYKNNDKRPVISVSHFKKILLALNDLTITYKIDPVENLFYDIVGFDKQYFSYENINTHPSFILNHLIYAIGFFSSDHKKREFAVRTMTTVKYLLHLQTNLIIDSNECNPPKRDYKRELYFPNSFYFNKLINHIILDYSKTFINTAGEIDKLIIDEKQMHNNPAQVGMEPYMYFSKPFLKVAEKLIVLDPTIITTACNHYILMMAKEYEVLNELIILFNKSIVNEAKNSIQKIDHPYKIYSLESNAPLISYLVEEFSERKIMLHVFVSDSPVDYGENSLLSNRTAYDYVIDDILKETIELLRNKYTYFFINISLITFGRSFFLGSNINLPCIMLSPYQLYIIAKNNRICNNILYYYTEEQNKRKNHFFSPFGDFTNFIIFDEHECSFYIDDRFPQKELNLFVEFDVIYEYVFRTFSLKNNNIIKYNNGLFKIDHIEKNKYFGVVNGKPSIIIKGKTEFFISLIFNKDNDSLLFPFADYFSYWLSETINYFINFKINYFIILIYSVSNEDLKVYKKGNGLYELIVSDKVMNQLSNCNDNYNEKSIFVSIISKIGIKFLEKDVNTVFGDILKKKIYAIDCKDAPFMIPSKNTEYPIPISSKAKMSNLLDDIGEYFVSNGIYKIGQIISGEGRGNICNKIVEYLFNLFVEKISKYNFMSVLKIAYASLESLISETILRNDNYKNQIRLYPEKEDEIRKILSEYNASSVSLRFIIEYVGAIQSVGELECDFIDLETLLAYVESILEWATTSDLFNYKMIGDDIQVLQSKRFGYDKVKVELINSYLSRSQFNYLSSEKHNYSYAVSMNEKNKIFSKDYGYSFEEYISILGLLYDYGEKITDEMKNISYKDWMTLCNEKSVPEKLRCIIDEICIEKRENYFKYKHYMKREFYPWRYNRVMSLFRRPLIKIDNAYYWGNKILNHNIYYISNLINHGLFNSGKRGNNYSLEYNGVIAYKRGEMFNDYILDLFNSFPNMCAYKNVVSINSKHISDDEGNDLGDIDVLAISKDLNKIFIVEVKDYSLARNINDLSIEIKKLFEGDEKSKSAYEKHIIRYNWVLNHLDDVCIEYKLNRNKWNVVPLFVTNQPMVSRKYDSYKNINMVDSSELTYQYIRKLKINKIINR